METCCDSLELVEGNILEQKFLRFPPSSSLRLERRSSRRLLSFCSSSQRSFSRSSRFQLVDISRRGRDQAQAGQEGRPSLRSIQDGEDSRFARPSTSSALQLFHLLTTPPLPFLSTDKDPIYDPYFTKSLPYPWPVRVASKPLTVHVTRDQIEEFANWDNSHAKTKFPKEICVLNVGAGSDTVVPP